MSRSRSWAARAARSLAAHLERLRDTLNRLNGRLREAVAGAVGGGAAAAVEDAVRALLAGPAVTNIDSPTYPSPSRAWTSADYRDHPSWASRGEATYDPYDEARHHDDEADSDAPEDQEGQSPASPHSCAAAGAWL